MPVYTEKVKDKNGNLVDKKVDGQKQYYIRTYVTDEFGNRKQITRHNKKWLGRDGQLTARAIDNQLRLEVQEEVKDIPFHDLCMSYLENEKKINKESTFYTYYQLVHKWILSLFPNKKTSKLCRMDFVKWRSELETNSLSLYSKNRCHYVMANILDFGIKDDLIKNNFEKALGKFEEKNEKVNKDKDNIRYITFDEFNKFINIVDDINWNTFFTFLYYTGMRKGEVQALTWEDIDFKNKKINVTKSLTVKTFETSYKITNTKTKENRKIDLDNHLIEVLKKYYAVQKKVDGFNDNFFVFGGLKPLSRSSIDRYKHFYFQKSGVKEITIHEFRHSHVSLIINEAIKKNLDMSSVFLMLSERMGHTIGVMQKTYMHLFPNIQNKIVEIMESLEKQDQKQDQK